MSEVKRLEMDHKGLPFVDDNGVYVLYEDYAELKAQRDALEQRAEAAESKLAELEKQEPVGSFHIYEGRVEATTDYLADGDWPVRNGEVRVYTRPAPVAKPAFFGYVYASKDGAAVNFSREVPLMPDRWNITPVYSMESQPQPELPEPAILRNIEEVVK